MNLPSLAIPNGVRSGAPRLWLCSMSSEPAAENYIEMIEPILPYLDGTIWSLNDVEADSPAAHYLESIKGAGKILYRSWPRGRHSHAMNDTLYCGPMEEDDSFYLWSDLLEHPAPAFVSRIKSEIIPMMNETDIDVIAAWGKPYLVRFKETLEYHNSPHWSLHGWNGRAIEWSTIEPDEKLVRFNARPTKRQEVNHWCKHYLRYMVEYPAGCNHSLLGIEQHGGDLQQAYSKREANRLAFRKEIKRRGYPLTTDGFVDMCKARGQPDDSLKAWLRSDKVFSDAYHWLVLGNGTIKDTHNPKDALPIL